MFNVSDPYSLNLDSGYLVNPDQEPGFRLSKIYFKKSLLEKKASSLPKRISKTSKHEIS
jgi:hypothetical protein